MPYDDIRFSWWDDPDDDDDDETLDRGDDPDDVVLSASWDKPSYNWDDEDIYLSYHDFCFMCGMERTVNDEGYCSSCWQVWKS